MAITRGPNVSQIAVQAATPAAQPPSLKFIPRPPSLLRTWAPAWFYSALNFLGRPYDASNTARRFAQYLAGSDVDPYVSLGSTRLFMIVRIGSMFRLTMAADATSVAPTAGGKWYPNTDEGILQMYLDLSASPAFGSVRYCYVPGLTGDDIPDSDVVRIRTGYDPATGMRSIVLGSAVSRVVPLDDFLATSNEQIYDDSPIIVPIATALVYDVSQYNALGATTFVLPVYYTYDQVSVGNYYVSKFASTTTVAGETAHCGQSVAFPGGPGYTDSAATALTLNISTELAAADHAFITYYYDTATVYAVATLIPKVQAGIVSLTCTAASPASVFANQRIIGFYRDLSATMTAQPSFAGSGPFLGSAGVSPFIGFDIAKSQHGGGGSVQVADYVLVQGILQWPQVNTNAETFADVQIYKSMSLLDTFPIGDPEVLIQFLTAQNPGAPFASNEEINLVFAKNIVSYFNAQQLTLIP